MRIIFEDEKEKTRFFAFMATNVCPGDLGLAGGRTEMTCANDAGKSCYECWNKLGIDILLPERRELKENPETLEEIIDKVYDTGFNECLDRILGNYKEEGTDD